MEGYLPSVTNGTSIAASRVTQIGSCIRKGECGVEDIWVLLIYGRVHGVLLCGGSCSG